MKGSMSVVVGVTLLAVGMVSRPPQKAIPPVEIFTTELMLGGSSEARATNWTFTGNMHAPTPATCVTTNAAQTSMTIPTVATKQFSQAIDVPARGITTLSYKVRVQSAGSQVSASDKLEVKINAAIIHTLSAADAHESYTTYTHDLSALAGTRAMTEFKWTYDDSRASHFCIDDVIASNLR